MELVSPDLFQDLRVNGADLRFSFSLADAGLFLDLLKRAFELLIEFVFLVNYPFLFQENPDQYARRA